MEKTTDQDKIREENEDRQGTRRSFIQKAAALGLGMPMASMLAGNPAFAGQVPDTFSAMKAMQNGGVELTLGLVEEPDTLDPHNLTAAAAGLVGYVVMPGLVWWDFDLGISPMLAESWEQSEDGLTWTFTLRPNLKFHNGKDLTAQEVVRNFEDILDIDKSFLAPDFEVVESVEAPDDLTVVFQLKEPFAPFLAVLTNRCAITDMDAVDPNKPIGAGAFKIVEWNRGTGIKMEAFEDYWEEGLPIASTVNWNFYPDTDSRQLGLQAGEIDIVFNVPANQIDQIQSEGWMHVEPVSGLQHLFIAFNCAEGPFSDVRVRKAVAHAIDKEMVVEGVLWGYADVVNIPFPPSSPWWVETPDYEYDPEKARELLAEAGFSDGFQVDFPVSNDAVSSMIAEIVQGDLAAIGIQAQIVQTEWATFWPETYLKSQFDITSLGYSARVDPDQTFYPRYHSEGVHNAVQYSNPRMDELLEAGRRELDQAVRKEIYDEVQQILVDELPWLWLYIPNVTMGWQNTITGFQAHSADHFYITEATRE